MLDNNTVTVASHKNLTIYGINSVASKLNYATELINKIIVYRQPRLNKRIEKIVKLAHKLNISVEFSKDKQYFNDANNHQGIVAYYTLPPTYGLAELDEILSTHQASNAQTGNNKKLLFLILDEITDPHNLGACLRTAAAATVDAVIVPAHNSADITETVIKVASGGDDLVPIIKINNLARVINILKQNNVWIVGTAANATQSIYEIDLNANIAWVFGSESKGMRSLTTKLCDMTAHIPINSKINSLNISVTTGICVFETIRQQT